MACNAGGSLGIGTLSLHDALPIWPITISAGDEGGPLTNGATATGTISTGDLDTWTFTATAGDHIGVEIGKLTDTNNGLFTPWIRVWAPNGTGLVNDAVGTAAASAASLDAVAPVSGTYLVLVASKDSGYLGTGTYQLTATYTPYDTDGDGCPDVKEAGANALLGGDRDPTNPWDFFDTPEPVLTPSATTGTFNH